MPSSSAVLHRPFPVPSLSLLRTFSRPLSTTPHLSAARVNKEKKALEKAKKKKRKHIFYKQHDLKEVEQFALCDAMRYIRAFEVGRPLRTQKYEAHLKLRTKRDGPVIRNQIRLPHSVKTDLKIAVICPSNSAAARQAREAGAAMVGEEEVFQVVKSGKFEFDRVIAQPGSLPKINKEGLGRILGPRGLMPSAKLGTLVEGVAGVVKTMLGGSMYRERVGVVRMAVGQLGFSPEMLRDNLRAFVGAVRKDGSALTEGGGQSVMKEIAEVVLSSTNAPGFSLNGEFKSALTPPLERLGGA